MKDYVPKSKKSANIKLLINQAIEILESAGIPISDTTERRLEKMAMSFLAVAHVKSNLKEASEKSKLKTREIITFINENFEENISSGSYDDIRRKDLHLLVLAGLVINNGENDGSATNNPTRSYSIAPEFRNLIITYNSNGWQNSLASFKENHSNLAELLVRKRQLDKIPVKLPNGNSILLSLGDHNLLHKAVVEEFLPRFGQDCSVLYIGDTSNKLLHIELEELKKLNFFELSHDKLPDIIAYSPNKNWLYLIEAVHSSGPMSEIRVFELKQLLNQCNAELIFVTAFISRMTFKKWILDIAWETEVWIADNPDHLVHFNGNKFLGAYEKSKD